MSNTKTEEFKKLNELISDCDSAIWILEGVVESCHREKEQLERKQNSAASLTHLMGGLFADSPEHQVLLNQYGENGARRAKAEHEIIEYKKKKSEYQAKMREMEANFSGSVGASPKSIPAGATAETLTKRGYLFLEDAEWDNADAYFNSALDLEPGYASAYVGLICADLKVQKEAELANVKDFNNIVNHKHYKRAIVDFDVKSRLDSHIQTIKARIDAKRKAAAAEAERKRRATEEEAERKRRAAEEEAERKRQAAVSESNKVLALLREKFDPKIKAEKLAKLQEKRKADEAQLKIENDNLKAAVESEQARLKQQYDTAYKAWQEVAGKIQIQSEQWKSQRLCPHDGGTLRGLFSKKCSNCGKAPNETIYIPPAPVQPKMPTFTPRKLDESLYVQDIDCNQRITLAGIEWRILNEQGGKLLLISEKIIEKRPYNVEYKDITWEHCTLRKYLNGEFLNKLGVIKSAIAETRNNNPNNQWYGIAGGNATTDKVFLLSLDEVCRYFGDSTVNLSKKGSTGSDYYINDKNSTKRVANYGSEGASWWWLRSPGSNSSDAANVSYDGDVSVYGNFVINDSGGVRPALWLNL